MKNTDGIKPHQFKPGETGNPDGRPKGSQNRSTIARKWLEIETSDENPLTGNIEKLEQQDLVILTLIKEARSGNVAAAKELLDSAYGKAVQQIESKNENFNHESIFEKIEPAE